MARAQQVRPLLWLHAGADLPAVYLMADAPVLGEATWSRSGRWLVALCLALGLHGLGWLMFHGFSGVRGHATSGAAVVMPLGAQRTHASGWSVRTQALPSAVVADRAHATIPSEPRHKLPEPNAAGLASDAREGGTVSDGDPNGPIPGMAVDMATQQALVPTTYTPAESLDQSARPIEDWVLDEAVLMAVRKGRIRVKVWVSDTGVVDGAELLAAEPPGDWAQQAIQPLRMTLMHPGMKDGRAVPSTVVVEIASEDQGYR